MKKATLLILFISLFSSFAHTQILYGLADYGSNDYLVQINTATCEVCPVLDIVNSTQYLDLAIFPNGNVITVGPLLISVYDPPSSTPIASLNTVPTGFAPYGVAISPSGTVYLSGLGLSTYDPVTNTITFIGPFPAAFPFVQDLYYQGTQLMGFDGGLCLVEINTINPLLSMYAGTCASGISFIEGAAFVPGTGLYLHDSEFLYLVDQATATAVPVCDHSGTNFEILALEYVPNSVPVPGCLCITNAGTVIPTPITRCVNQTATVPYNNNANLDGNDVLQYILFSNTNDTLGSIIAVNNTGVFNFNSSTMQTGVTYYLATMAGNNLNGNVNPNDPCLDFSNAATLIWRLTPAVAFTVNTPNICAGNCQTINVTITGTPPFTLTYNTSYATGLTQAFTGNTGTISVCVPAGASVGLIEVIATSLVDALCTCQ
jgi:hypothetical protein